MKSKPLFAALAFLLILLSCNNRSGNDLKTQDIQAAEISTYDQNLTFQESEEQVQQTQLQTDSTARPPQVISSSNIDWDKKIIKTATIRLEVNDFKTFNDLAHKTVRQYGGYVAQEDNNISEYKTEATISIKVPVNKFEDLMNGLNNADTKLLERKITTEDVTGEVIDTKSRLEAKKEMRLKYLQFLKQSKNMKEVLEVQTEINAIQEEIESATGRIGYLTHQAAYSTINLTFFQTLNGYKPDDNNSFYKRVSYAFKGGADGIKNIFIGLIYIWPLLLVVGFGFYLLKKKKVVKVIPQ